MIRTKYVCSAGRVGLIFIALLLLMPARPAAQDELFVAVLALPAEVEEWLARESSRLRNLCRAPECYARELERKTWVLERVRSSADSNASHIGDLVARAESADGDVIVVEVEYWPLRGRRAVWLGAGDIGDWGYGTYVVVRGRGNPQRRDQPAWIRLGGIPVPAWIQLQPFAGDDKGRKLRGELSPLPGQVLSAARTIPAIHRRTGRTVMLSPEAHYTIERVTKDQLFLRTEVGADMPCGDAEAEKDVVTPATPRYRVAVENIFGADGRPLLLVAYGRGC